jgi:hypothetical protein
VNAADWINLTGVVVSAGAAGFAVLPARRARAAEVQADRYRARAEQDAERARRRQPKIPPPRSGSPLMRPGALPTLWRNRTNLPQSKRI